MKKKVKIGIVILSVITSFGTGVCAQSYFYTKNEVQESNEEYTSEEIVIVNLDEGIQKTEITINYGNEFLAKMNVNVVGLMEAREKLASGEYAGYIMIPENFSKSVESIHLVNPDLAVLKYELSDNLNKEAQKKAMHQLNAIQDTLNYEIGYMYLTAILKEVHDGQEQVSMVIQNDEEVVSAINSVQNDDLIEMVEMKSYKPIEKELDVFDTSEIETNYQTAINEIKDINEENGNTITKTYEQLNNSLMKLNEEQFVWNLFMDDDGKFVYDGTLLKNMLTKDLTNHTHTVIDKSVDMIVDKGLLSTIDITINDVLTLLSKEMDKNYKVIDEKKIKDLQDDLQTSCMKTLVVKHPKDASQNTTKVNPSYSSAKCEQVVMDLNDGVYDTTFNASTYIPSTINIDGDEVDLKEQIKEDVQTKVSNQTSKLKTLIQEDGNIQTNIERIRDAILEVDPTTNEIRGGYIKDNLISSLDNHYEDYQEQMRELNEEIEHVSEHSNDDSIKENLIQTNTKIENQYANIHHNTSFLVQSINAFTKAYEIKQKEIELDANKTLMEIVKDGMDAQQTASKKVEDGLQGAKKTIYASTKNNKDLLMEFTSKLKNTRYQETQSKEVKDHILNPTIKETDAQLQPSKVSTKKIVEPSKGLRYIVGIGFVLLTSIAYVVFRRNRT